MRFGRRSARGRRPAARPPASERETVVDEAAPGGPPVVEEWEEPPPPPPRGPLLWPWILLLLLLVIGGIVAAILLTHHGKKHHRAAGPQKVTVPNVVGMKQTKAVQRVNAAHLAPTLQSRASKFPRGTVFAEQPRAGTQVTRESAVTLFVSAVRTVRVPSVVGTKSAVAARRLRALGLASTATTVTSRTAAGMVISQSPAAGTQVGKGSTIALKISRGLATVPDVVGSKRAAAEGTLRAAGLVPSVFTVPAAQARGTVTAQRPQAGTRVPKGSKVRINVSNGTGGGATTAPTTTTTTTTPAATVRVPSFVGASGTFAQRRLVNAGLRARVVYVRSSQTAGRVLSQSPAAGTRVRRGTRVLLNVSAGPTAGAFQSVPDVVGNDQPTATSTLQGAGFKVYVIPLKVADQSSDGKVVDEQPSAASRAPRGATITIYVGRFTG
jgi:beta-lactam-binding protein with PASTA domain